MARGEHPNSRANLKPFEKGLPEKHQRETQRKGVEKASEVRSLNANLRDKCTADVMDELNDRLLQMAKHGNLRAYELVRDGLGEKPTEKHEVTINDDSMREMDEFFERADKEPAEE